MGVDKIIVRAILSTLAAIGALIIFMALSLCLFFPSTMMELSYGLGMESSSIRFAERAYEGSEDVYYIAYATEVAIEEGDEKKIVSCGEKLVNDTDFNGYCESKNEDYKQFVFRQLCVSKYRLGDGADAVSLAYDSLQGKFPLNNSLVAVLMEAIGRTDLIVVEWGVEKLATIQASGEEGTYLNEVLRICNEALQEYDAQ